MTRYAWSMWLMCLGGAGCHSTLPGLGVLATAPPAATAQDSRPSAAPQFEPTDLVSRSRDTQADALGVGRVAQVAQIPKGGSRLLDQAAASYELGDDAQAVVHLEAYVASRPEHLIARAQLAELLFRQKRDDEARLHFEVFIAQAQEHANLAFRYLIHSHSRLVDIAQTHEDEYEEKLNRGIGLYLLGCKRTEERDAEQPPTADALLCKAAAQLQDARKLEPAEARPNWYLHQVWSRLGQSSAARRALAGADAYALLSHLTPAERRHLQQACLGNDR